MIGIEWASIARIYCVWRFSNRVALVCERTRIKTVVPLFFLVCGCDVQLYMSVSRDFNNEWSHRSSTMQTCKYFLFVYLYV